MLIVIAQKISKPLSYLNIRHEQKFAIDVILPVLLAVVSYYAVNATSSPIQIVGDKSLVTHINGLLQMLIGFFVASLAAVATFQRPGMDELMQGKPPVLNNRELTRREFLSYMFGYLAFASILTYLISGAVQLSLPALKETFIDNYELISKIGTFTYLVVIFNILTTTLLALYFLTDRVVRVEEERPEIEVDSDD